MRIRYLAVGLSAVALLAAACHRKPETPAKPPPPATPASQPAPQTLDQPHNFSHEADFDAAGFYFTQSNIRSGAWRLARVGVGAPSDFETWEAGDRGSSFGPIVFEFEDAASPSQAGETGGEGHSGSIRILPDAYVLNGQRLAFFGHDKTLGQVTFDGRLDKAALTEAKANGSSQTAVLTGTLKVGGKTYDKVSFTYFVGD